MYILPKFIIDKPVKLDHYKRVFVFESKNMLKKQKRPEKRLFFSNQFTWHKRQLIWHFLFSGFYFDELFSKIIKRFVSSYMILPSFFVFDKFFSAWTGAKIFKNLLSVFNAYFYFEKFDTFTMLLVLILGVPVFSGLFYIILIFLF